MARELEEVPGALKDAIEGGSRSLVRLASDHVFSRVRLLDPSVGLHALVAATTPNIPEDLASEVRERVAELVEACVFEAKDGEAAKGDGEA